MPDSSKDEDWRRTDVSKLNLDAFSPSLNGANAPALESESLPDGVIFCTLEEAIQRWPDLVREQLSAPSGKFEALNAALWSGGAFVYVPENAQVELPLVATYGSVGSGESGVAAALFPRTLVIVDRGACVTFVDHFASDDSRLASHASLSSASTHLVVKEGARLQYVSLQERSQLTWHFARERAMVARDAK